MKHRVSQLIGKSFHRIIPVFLLILIACNEEGELIVNNNSSSGPSVVYMWVSSADTDGNIGGVNGATTICEGDAAGIAGLAAGLTHRAVIATVSNNPSNYFSNNPPVRRPDGTLISNTYAVFFNPAQTITNSILPTTPALSSWTGIANDGISTSRNNCQNWTNSSTSLDGTKSATNVVDIKRFYDGDLNCSYFNKVLCISY